MPVETIAWVVPELPSVTYLARMKLLVTVAGVPGVVPVIDDDVRRSAPPSG
jgi:hypothetical protein